MANQIVSVHAGISGMGIYAIMLPSGVFSVAHSWLAVCLSVSEVLWRSAVAYCVHVLTVCVSVFVRGVVAVGGRLLCPCTYWLCVCLYQRCCGGRRSLIESMYLLAVCLSVSEVLLRSAVAYCVHVLTGCVSVCIRGVVAVGGRLLCPCTYWLCVCLYQRCCGGRRRAPCCLRCCTRCCCCPYTGCARCCMNYCACCPCWTSSVVCFPCVRCWRTRRWSGPWQVRRSPGLLASGSSHNHTLTIWYQNQFG